MSRPVIGIIACSFLINDDYHIFGAGKLNAAAVAEACGAMPMIVPTDPALVSIPELMAFCDGFVFTGARANVHPEEYGEAETEAARQVILRHLEDLESTTQDDPPTC